MKNIDHEQLVDAVALSAGSLPLNLFLTDIPDRPTKRPAELDGQGRIGAVLLLVVSMQRRPKVVLTRRSSKLKNHAGQISFPGGSRDETETLQAAALRETEEEIGVTRDDIKVIGQLNSVYIPPSDFTIYPFVGCCVGTPEFHRSPNEVAEIILASLDDLMSPAASQFGQVDSPDGPVNAQFFKVNGHRVWGATGIVLNDFLQRLGLVVPH